MAQIVDRAGVDIVSVGDSVGVNMWGQRSASSRSRSTKCCLPAKPSDGASRALLSAVIFPYGPMQEGMEAAVRAAARALVENGRSGHGEARRARTISRRFVPIAAAGIPVWAQFGITPHTAKPLRRDVECLARIWPGQMTEQFVAEAEAA